MAGNLDELRKPHVIELRRAQTEVAQAVGQVGIIGIEFGQQPGRIGIRRMQPHDRKRIVLFVAGSARPGVKEAGAWLAGNTVPVVDHGPSAAYLRRTEERLARKEGVRTCRSRW